MATWTKPHPRKRVVARVCVHCGAGFEAPEWRVAQGKAKYCSRQCYSHGKRRQRGVEHNGLWFGEDPRSGYLWHKRNNGEGVSLHRYVWEATNGPVPDGFVVHHIDHKKHNCALGNLELMGPSEHATMHGLERRDAGAIGTKGLDAAREAAKLWHKSDAGRAWHSSAAKASAPRAVVQFAETRCQHCGKTYEFECKPGRALAKRYACSPKCMQHLLRRERKGVQHNYEWVAPVLRERRARS